VADPEDKRVAVTATDPVTGESATQLLDPSSYVLIVGEHRYLDGIVQHANGTIQLTIKRKTEVRGW